MSESGHADQLGIHINSRLGLSKIGTRQHGKLQVECCGTHRVYRIIQIDVEIYASLDRFRLANQALGLIFPNSPVVRLVGIRESRFSNWFYKTKMIKGFGHGVEAGCDIVQSIPGVHPREDHASELFVTSETSNGKRGLVLLYDAV